MNKNPFSLCETCSKQDTCTEICPAVEAMLPKMSGGAVAKMLRPSKKRLYRVHLKQARTHLILDNRSKMSLAEQEIVELFYICEYSIHEVAYVLDTSYASVKSYLYRIRKQYG